MISAPALLLRYPWGLCSEDQDITALSSDKIVEYSGANTLANLVGQRRGVHTEPHRKLGAGELGPVLHDIAHDTKNKGELQIWLNSDVELTLTGLLVKVQETTGFNINYVDGWADFFQELYYWKEEHSKSLDSYTWNDIREFIENSAEEPRDAKLALIIEISDVFGSSIEAIVGSMNAVLNRERTMQDVSRAKEFDSQCIKSISRNPGSTLREKIGSQKKILSARRVHNYDSFENRILKDFLYRCSIEAGRYFRNTQWRFRSSKRVRLANAFADTCRRLLNDERFSHVRSPNLGDPPSYVILHNAKYRKVWNYYLRLLRLQEERDDLWRWQNRTWAEINRLLVSVCLYRLVALPNANLKYKIESLLEGQPILNHQQIRGLRMGAGCEPGPFLLKTHDDRPCFILDVVNSYQVSENPLTVDLTELGAQLILILSPIDNKNGNIAIIPVWSINNISSSNPFSVDDASDSLERAISNVNNRLKKKGSNKIVYGLGILNKSETFEIASERDTHTLIRCPENYHKWKRGLEETLPLVLDDLIERATAQ